MTFATISFSVNIPVANAILRMIERCSRILVAMLVGPANFSGLKFEIVSIISCFVQSKMKNES